MREFTEAKTGELITAEAGSNQLAKGDPLLCPHCGARQPDEVEAYVVAGTLAMAIDSCEACNKRFMVLELDSGLFKVRKLNTPSPKRND